MSKNNNLPETEDYGNDIVTLVDEDGNENEFEIVDCHVNEKGEYYFALLPVANGENAGSGIDALLVLKSVKEDGEELLEPIEDDEEYESVAEIFTERLKDIFNFES